MQKPPKKYRRLRGPSRGVSLILLAAALAVGLGFWYLAGWKDSQDSGTESAIPYRTLFSREKTQIARISVSLKDGGGFVLLGDNGKLTPEGQPDFEMDPRLQGELLTACAIIEAVDTVSEKREEWEPHRKDFGLDTPQASVEVDYTTGESAVFFLGGKTLEDNYNYMELQGDPGLYLASADMIELFSTEVSALRAIDQPVIHQGRIDRITLLNASGAATAEWALDGDILAEDAMYFWRMTTPFQYSCDVTAMQDLTAALSKLYLGSDIAQATEENVAQYGLSSPQRTLVIHQAAAQVADVDDSGAYAVNDYAESTFTLKVGSAQRDYVYYCQAGDRIYLVSSLSLPIIGEFAPEGTLNLQPFNLPLETLASLTVKMGASSAEYTLDHSEEASGEEEAAQKITVWKNGEEASYDDFSARMASLQAVTVSGRLPQGFASDAAPSYSMVLTFLNGRTRTVECVPYDALHDALRVDGVFLHYLIKGELEEIFTP
jgi:hypothetical protein